MGSTDYRSHVTPINFRTVLRFFAKNLYFQKFLLCISISISLKKIHSALPIPMHVIAIVSVQWVIR